MGRGERRSRAERCVAAVLGLLVALVLLEVTLRLVGASYSWSHQRDSARRLAERGEVTVLCLGESTTAIGGPRAWPGQLQEVLGEGPAAARYTVINEGVPGADSSVLLARLEHQLDTYRPDLVAVMMGANDNHKWYGGGAVPVGDAPQAAQTGILRSLKTYEFFELAYYTLGGGGARGTTLDQVRRWYPDGLCAAHAAGDAEERACARHVGRAWTLTAAGHTRLAERRFLKGVAAEEESAVVRAEYGIFLAYLGRGDEARAAFEDAVSVDPDNPGIHGEYGGFLLDSMQADEAAQQFRRVRDLVGGEGAALHGLGRALAFSDRCRQAIPLLREAVVVEPGRPMGLETLARCHAIVGNDRAAIENLTAAVERSSGADWFDMPLWQVTEMLEQKGRHEEVRALFDKALEERPLDVSLAARVASYYERTGDQEKADRYREIGHQLSRDYVCPLTFQSYAQLREMLDERGIGLVAVQYPRRPVEGLQALFPDPDGIVFVDNQESFDRRIESGGYFSLFVDRGYGDFGHTSDEGSRLLAENVGAAILERYGETFDARVSER